MDIERLAVRSKKRPEVLEYPAYLKPFKPKGLVVCES